MSLSCILISERLRAKKERSDWQLIRLRIVGQDKKGFNAQQKMAGLYPMGFKLLTGSFIGELSANWATVTAYSTLNNYLKIELLIKMIIDNQSTPN